MQCTTRQWKLMHSYPKKSDSSSWEVFLSPCCNILHTILCFTKRWTSTHPCLCDWIFQRCPIMTLSPVINEAETKFRTSRCYNYEQSWYSKAWQTLSLGCFQLVKTQEGLTNYWMLIYFCFKQRPSLLRFGVVDQKEEDKGEMYQIRA